MQVAWRQEHRPKTAEGKARAAAAHTKHGRRSRAHVEKVKVINAELRRITLLGGLAVSLDRFGNTNHGTFCK
jgi:hypothetical protein